MVMKKYNDNMDFLLYGDDVNAKSPKTITVSSKHGRNVSFTGRSISSKLVISKNKSTYGENTTIIMKKKYSSKNRYQWYYLFYPVSDIYLDFNKTELIMPYNKPVYVAKSLYTEIIPSRKYPRCYVFAPDSDIETIFKEFFIPNYGKIWVLTYEKATLHLMRYYQGPTYLRSCPTSEDLENEGN